MRRRRRGGIGFSLGRTRRGWPAPAVHWPATSGVTLLVALAVTGLCLFYLWQGALILDLTAKREAAREALTATEEVNRSLEFEIGQAFSLERVSRIARTTLHMVEPTNTRYVHLEPATEDR